MNQYFDKIIYINSRNRVDRFKNMRSRLKTLGVDAERFEAVLGGSLPRTSISFGKPIKPLNNGEIGCFQSHVNIFKMIKENGWKRTLILEDDALFYTDQIRKHSIESPDHFNEVFSLIEKGLPKDWDMLYLGQRNYDTQENASKIKGETAALKDRITDNITYNLYTADRCWLTHAYAVDIKCIDYLLENTKHMYSSFDNVLADIQSPLKVVAVYPNLVIQDATKSSLR